MTPGWPSPVTHVPIALFAWPIGETTAAVPHAKVSVISPEAIPACQSEVLIIPSSTLYPRSAATLKIESRVTPGNKVPVSFGVKIVASAPFPLTK